MTAQTAASLSLNGTRAEKSSKDSRRLRLWWTGGSGGRTTCSPPLSPLGVTRSSCSCSDHPVTLRGATVRSVPYHFSDSSTIVPSSCISSTISEIRSTRLVGSSSELRSTATESGS